MSAVAPSFQNDMTDIHDWITLSLLPGVGPTVFWRLVNHFGSPSLTLTASKNALSGVEGVSHRYVKGFDTIPSVQKRVLEELDKLGQRGGEAIVFEDTYYPPLLRRICDPPPVIYVEGDKELLLSPSIAIVGSRASTTYGQRVSYSLAKDLAGESYTVTSGLALGIDSHAHQGALSAEGKTIAVLGCGLDIQYPRQNKKLHGQIRSNGLLVSEYTLGTRPEGYRFPARNRIISGMSEGVVVVEAAKRSGSLITAQLALDEGREVFAVPGPVDSYKSIGAHWLLQQGAKLVQNVDDVLDELRPQITTQVINREVYEETDIKRLDPDAILLLQCVETCSCPRDSLVEKTGFPIWHVSEMLLLLELEGLVEILPGDEVRKIGQFGRN